MGATLIDSYRFAGPTFSPSDIAGLVAWFQADAITAADGDPVASWADSSGNGNAAAQATATKQPTYRTAVVNGKPVVRYDGGDSLKTAPFTLTQPHTVFVVGRMSVMDTTTFFIDGNVSFIILGANSTNRWRIYAGAANVESVAAIDTNWHVFAGTYNSAASSLSVDGVVATGDAGPQSLGGLTIGSDSTGNGPAHFLTGDVAEVIAYNAALSTADRQSVEAYLGDKYGIAV